MDCHLDDKYSPHHRWGSQVKNRQLKRVNRLEIG